MKSRPEFWLKDDCTPTEPSSWRKIKRWRGRIPLLYGKFRFIVNSCYKNVFFWLQITYMSDNIKILGLKCELSKILILFFSDHFLTTLAAWFSLFSYWKVNYLMPEFDFEWMTFTFNVNNTVVSERNNTCLPHCTEIYKRLQPTGSQLSNTFK